MQPSSVQSTNTIRVCRTNRTPCATNARSPKSSTCTRISLGAQESEYLHSRSEKNPNSNPTVSSVSRLTMKFTRQRIHRDAHLILNFPIPLQRSPRTNPFHVLPGESLGRRSDHPAERRWTAIRECSIFIPSSAIFPSVGERRRTCSFSYLYQRMSKSFLSEPAREGKGRKGGREGAAHS